MRRDDWQNLERLPATVDGRQPVVLRDVDDPEQFYDYIAEWRAAQRRRQYVLTILAGAVIGLLIGLGLWIFAVVQ